MKITMARHLCDHILPECERCFARFMLNPEGEDRPCITDYVDASRGDPLLSLKLRYDAQEELLVLSPEERESVACEGWSRFVKLQPKFYRE